MEQQFYTYHEKGIIIIDLPSYSTFQSRLSYNKKKIKSKKTNTFFYFFQLYLNSLVYFYPNSSEQELFHISNIILKENIQFMDFNILNKMFKKAIKNNKSDKPKYYTSIKSFIWDNEGLKKHFNNDKESIKNYKFSIIAKYNKKKSLKEKEDKIKEEILFYINSGKYKSQIIKYLLNKKYDKDYIYKMIKEFEIKERNNTYILLDELFKKLFNKELKEKLTIENILFYLNNTKVWDEITEEFILLDIKKDTYYRYLKETPEIKQKIKDINNSLKPIVEKEIIKKQLNDKNDDEWLNDDVILEVKKIITWDEMIEIEEKVEEEDQEWLDFLDNKNKEKIIA